MIQAGDTIITLPREIGNLRKNRVTYYGGAKTAVPRVDAGVSRHNLHRFHLSNRCRHATRFYRCRLAVVFLHEIEDVVSANEYFKTYLGVEDGVGDCGAEPGASAEYDDR